MRRTLSLLLIALFCLGLTACGPREHRVLATSAVGAVAGAGLTAAFDGDPLAGALIGGGIGYALKTAISQGAKRGLFSNEAGMGSTPHAHALANVRTNDGENFVNKYVVATIASRAMLFEGTWEKYHKAENNAFYDKSVTDEKIRSYFTQAAAAA